MRSNGNFLTAQSFVCWMVALLGISSCGRVVVKKQVLKVPELNWGVPYKFYLPSEMKPAIAKAGSAVVQIIDPVSDTMGSGFFISSSGVLMTAAHVIPRERCYVDSCKGIIAIRDSRPGGANEVFRYFEPLLIDTKHDFGIYQLRSKPNEIPVGVPFLKIHYEEPKMGEQHWLVGHPLGGAQKFSEFIPQLLEDNLQIRGFTPMIFGNSGGPVITSSGEALGIAIAINTDYDNIRTNGVVPSYGIIWPAAYLLAVLQESDKIAVACGLTEVNVSGVLKGANPSDQITEMTIERLKVCNHQPLAKRDSTSYWSLLLPKSLAMQSGDSFEGSRDSFLFHAALNKKTVENLPYKFLMDGQFMNSALAIYRSLANRIGIWFMDSQIFQTFRVAYEKPMDVLLFSNSLAIGGAHQNSSGPVFFQTKVQDRSLSLGKDCVSKLKLDGSPLVKALIVLNECQILPEELDALHREGILRELKNDASVWPEHVASALELLSDYLMNGGDPLTPAELQTVLDIAKTVSKETTSLKVFMSIDKNFYRFQYPEIFNNERLFKPAL